MSISEFNCYKMYVINRVRNMPRSGRGEFARIAKALGIQASFVSQIFNGPKHLTQDQAYALADYLGLTSDECRYFLILVRLARVENSGLKKMIQQELHDLKMQITRNGLQKHEPAARAFGNAEQAIFTSSWHYSAVHILSSIPGMQGIDTMAERLHLPKSLIREIVDFLVAHGLCAEEGGKVIVKNRINVIAPNSAFASRLQTLLRLRALSQIPEKTERDFFYSFPMSIGVEDHAWIRGEIDQLIQRVRERVAQTRPEQMSCLNIDWFPVVSS